MHGYDMNCLAILPVLDENMPAGFVSGGDEKVLRTFEAPYSFVKLFN